MNSNKIFKSRFLRLGMPFIGMIVGGSFGLKYFTELRYKYRNKKILNRDELEQMGIDMKEEKPTLETEYKKLQELDLDTWSNVRGPRPWEDSKSIQQELRKTQS